MSPALVNVRFDAKDNKWLASMNTTKEALKAAPEFKYPKYFSVLPTGPDTKPSFTEGLFQVAMQQTPKPETVFPTTVTFVPTSFARIPVFW